MEKTEFLTHQRAGVLNKNMVLNYIRTHSPVTRTEIWDKLNLSRASVTQITKRLIELGLIQVMGPTESDSGRRPILLKFNENAKAILVFDWHSKMLAALNLNSEVTARKILKIPDVLKPDEFVILLKNEIDEFLESLKIKKNHILGLGLIMQGIINSERGEVVLISELDWKNVQLKDLVEKKTGMKTVVEADGNMHALGEYLYGSAKGIRNFVLCEMEESGIGMSMVLKGELYRGENNMVGEIGHIRLAENRPLCSCSKTGCLEALIKESVLKEKGKWNEESIGYLTFIISMLVNMLDPMMVIFSGSLIEKEDRAFILRIKKAVLSEVINGDKRNIKFVKSMLGVMSRIKGMSGLIYNNIFDRISADSFRTMETHLQDSM